MVLLSVDFISTDFFGKKFHQLDSLERKQALHTETKMKSTRQPRICRSKQNNDNQCVIKSTMGKKSHSTFCISLTISYFLRTDYFTKRPKRRSMRGSVSFMQRPTPKASRSVPQ